MKGKLQVGQAIYFKGESLPYTLNAISERYGIVTRPLDRKEDYDLLEHEVKMQAYGSLEQAFKALKESPVYSLLDFVENKKAPNNMVFNPYDYTDPESIEECLNDLISGKVELSRRNSCDLEIDWQKTLPGEAIKPITEKHFPNSSNIARAKYDEEEKVLQVHFKNGGVYNYEEVPAGIWSGMCEADSVGAFLSSHIRGKFKATRFN